MAFQVEQRRPASSLESCKQWSPCADGKHKTKAAAEADRDFWIGYDAFYMLTGWEYQIREVKK
jgi:hypothetical protein